MTRAPPPDDPPLAAALRACAAGFYPAEAIRPVVTAIRALERMVPAGAHLFDHDVHDTMSRPGTGSLKTATLGGRIEGAYSSMCLCLRVTGK